VAKIWAVVEKDQADTVSVGSAVETPGSSVSMSSVFSSASSVVKGESPMAADTSVPSSSAEGASILACT
jgi:hypothetical protein